MYTIDEGYIIDSFQSLLNDMDTIVYASYFCELILIGLQDEESNRELFKDFVKSLYLMKNQAVNLEILARTFELKLLHATGYGFNFNNCSICGRKIDKCNCLNIEYHGGICSECSKSGGLNISYGAYSALKFLNNIPIENIYRISLNDDLKKELFKILNIFISQSFAKEPKSLEVFNYIKKE